MPRKPHRDADKRFDSRRKGAVRRSDYFEGVLYGLSTMAPDQCMSYKNMTPKEKERAWSRYSCKLIIVAADMTNEFKELNK